MLESVPPMFSSQSFKASGLKIMPFAATWMDLEIIILSEVSERQTSYHLCVES